MTSNSQVTRRAAPLFAAFAFCIPGALALVLAPSIRAALSALTVTATTALVVAVLYRYRPIRLALHLFLLLAPIAVFYRLLYRGSISVGVLLSVISTTSAETTELLGNHIWLTLALVVFVLLALYTAFACWRSCDPFTTKARAIFALTAGCAFWSLAAVSHYQLGEQRGNLYWALKDSLREQFPVDFILSSKIVLTGAIETRRETAARSHFKFEGVHKTSADEKNGIYVVVIGEASRRRSWSLYGYKRPTTPQLDAMKDQLVVFRNALSNANITIYSLSLTLTRATPETWNLAAKERSIIGLLRQGGYSVSWISNQERFGGAENRVSAIALEANSTSFANDYSTDPGTERDAFDSNLLPRLKTQLAHASAADGTVIFVHMMGSHDTYRERYPSGFNVFGGDLTFDPSRSLTERQRRIIDEYDNSVRFTDYVLTKIIEQVAALDTSSAVMYFSDHGERLFDDDAPGLQGHGFPTPSAQELEIPFLIWLSPAYRVSHPDLSRILEENAQTTAQLTDVFETLVDLAGLTYEGRAPSVSLFSSSLRAPKRLEVLSTAQVPICLPLESTSDLDTSMDHASLKSPLAFVACVR